MNINQKIAAVMQDVSYLSKDDTVETGAGRGYKAISEEKVTSVVRESLLKHGLVILPVRQEHTRTDETVVDRSGKEKINRIATVDVTYQIRSIDSDEVIEVVSSGTGVDTQDKAVGKAMTYAYKYMLLRTFAIPTGEDPDKISSEIYSEKMTEAPALQPVDDSTLQATGRTLAKAGMTAAQGLDWIQKRFKRHPSQLTDCTWEECIALMQAIEAKLEQKAKEQQ